MPQKEFEWPAGRSSAAMVTVDLDAESCILHTHPQAAEQLDILAHQAYGTRTGVYRLLRIFERRSVRATFFIPGFVADRWPAVVRDIQAAGHEIGHHGYMHEYLAGADRTTEEDYLLRGLDALERVTGKRPLGYRAPGFKLNQRSPGLLAEHGFLYDSSLQDTDVPYRLAAGPEDHAASVIELPVQWSLDDFAHYIHLPGIRPGTGIASPSHVLDIWSSELEALSAEGGCFNLTLHPFLSGRASRARTVERTIELMQSIDNLWIAPAIDVARHAESVSIERVWHRPVELSELYLER
ncbi:polysaccharide deacetylase (plasmid) [Arthrobacter sp. TES]|nr:polysaccharide deacetylase [Arthrobacter sp. TES]